jgi:hypothetical protein
VSLNSSGAGSLADLEMPADKFPLTRPGWPDDWAGNRSRKRSR